MTDRRWPSDVLIPFRVVPRREPDRMAVNPLAGRRFLH
jgi:hypothetical protein